MARYGLVCLIVAGLAWAQSANSPSPAPQLATRPATPGSQVQAAPGAPPAENEQPDLSKVSPATPVITINGLCENPPADKSASSDCKTVVTREEFEKIMNAVQPNMPPRARRQFATRYATFFAMSQKAHDMGLDKNPEFEEQMNLARIQILSRELNRSIQEKASQISDKDLQDYYDGHQADFEEADLERIVVPRAAQSSAAKAKPSDDKAEKPAAAVNMKAEADKIHARAVAGEDFHKLQEAAYVAAAVKTKAPSVAMNDVRRSGLVPAEASVMDLKEGAVSQVFSDGSGYVIYKVKKKEVEPLDKVKEEIRGMLRNQRVQEQMQAVEHSVTTNLDDDYFGPAAGPQLPGMNLPPRPTSNRPN